MVAEFKQIQKLDQGLLLTPQLKRSLEILQKPSLELRDMISYELQNNPTLEEVSDFEIERPATVGDSDDEYSDDYASPLPDTQENSDTQNIQAKRDFVMNSLADKESLVEHLLNEATLDAKTPQVAQAYIALLGFMDERGFITRQVPEKVREMGFDQETVDEALELLRNSEPSGIGAFDMRDSLLLQLEHKHLSGSLAYRILDEHYELLLKRKISEIAEFENKTPADVETALCEIAKLKTSPAVDFITDQERIITPDIAYLKIEGVWTAELTNEYIPKLRIDSQYRQMIADGKLRKSEESYIKEKINDGKFLMNAIEERQKTLLRIANAILIRQERFFEEGVSALKPMTMQDIADMVEVHPTTVGRAVADKYAQTPFGILTLKFFFGGGFSQNGEEGISSTSVKTRIKEIVDSESAQSPLSDSKIAEILSSEGITLARRTVAKYREELNIAPKSLRKHF